MIFESEGKTRTESFVTKDSERLRSSRPVSIESLLSEAPPEELQAHPISQARVFLFRDNKKDSTEYTAVFTHAFIPKEYWAFFQEIARYKREWPSAVTTDWNMHKDKEKSHAWLKDAWTDFIPHLEVLKRSLQPKDGKGNTQNPRIFAVLDPDSFLLPISRWEVSDDGVRTLITEHEKSPRAPQVERFIGKWFEQQGWNNYEPDRADELIGFAVNVFLAHEVRSKWKPFMNHKAQESDRQNPGYNFIGPAQIITRALWEREKILAHEFYPNVERRLKLDGEH